MVFGCPKPASVAHTEIISSKAFTRVGPTHRRRFDDHGTSVCVKKSSRVRRVVRAPVDSTVPLPPGERGVVVGGPLRARRLLLLPRGGAAGLHELAELGVGWHWLLVSQCSPGWWGAVGPVANRPHEEVEFPLCVGVGWAPKTGGSVCFPRLSAPRTDSFPPHRPPLLSPGKEGKLWGFGDGGSTGAYVGRLGSDTRRLRGEVGK